MSSKNIKDIVGGDVISLIALSSQVFGINLETMIGLFAQKH